MKFSQTPLQNRIVYYASGKILYTHIFIAVYVKEMLLLPSYFRIKFRFDIFKGSLSLNWEILSKSQWIYFLSNIPNARVVLQWTIQEKSYLCPDNTYIKFDIIFLLRFFFDHMKRYCFRRDFVWGGMQIVRYKSSKTIHNIMLSPNVRACNFQQNYLYILTTLEHWIVFASTN